MLLHSLVAGGVGFFAEHVLEVTMAAYLRPLPRIITAIVAEQHVGIGFEEVPHDSQHTAKSRNHQRRDPLPVFSVEGGIGGEERPHDFDAAVVDRHHERRVASLIEDGVDVGAGGEERPYGFDAAALARVRAERRDVRVDGRRLDE